MSLLLANNANGGVNGTAVAYGNMGETSGHAWDFIYTGTGANITYVNNPSRGALSYQFRTTTSDQAYVEWQRMPDLSTIYFRFLVYIPTLPSATTRVCELNDGTNLIMSISIRTDGRLNIRDSAANLMSLTTVGVIPGRWARIEASVVSHASTGSSVVRIYTEPDSPYPAEKASSTATFNTKPSTNFVRGIRFGLAGLNVTNTTVYVDGMAVADTGFLGPSNPTQTASLLWSNTAESGTHATAVTSINSGNATNDFFQAVDQASSITYSNAQAAHGSLSYFIQSASAVENKLVWKNIASSSCALRLYAYFTTYPSSPYEFAYFSKNSVAFDLLSRLGLQPDGKISAYDRTGIVWSSSGSVSLNSWYRFEILAQIGASATTGTIQAAFYSLDSTSPIHSFTTSSANLGTSNIEWVGVGKTSASSASDSFYIDDVAVRQQASGFIGPYTGPPTPPAAYPGIIPFLGWGTEI